MYLSSRDAWRADSSARVNPLARASSPIASAVVPVTVSVSPERWVTVAPWAVSSASSAAAWAVGQEVMHCRLRDQTAAPYDDQPVGGHGHLAHQVTGQQNGAALGGQ